ncbi:amidohydrolase family protein [Paraburkholderia rhizosphaerae]|uniref:Cytosine/adenosine deaminase-related metal-dependent hydrolase n=1 Tax=Paraburkholderia rhizosphaerae TaxID=480658 RepID=A0A4V3HDT2_9BURK|nr:amidohydrolase family protein [Paraburkholderia rhizosphaerae]TDY42284.1 cytosine/adenosine deaminase-related metal-dependent hydrolase [Paraburkholderia rhizosphaerae]
MSTAIDCTWLLADPGTQAAQADMRIAIDNGRIATLTASPTTITPTSPRRVALPALSNAHDHGRYLRSASVGAFDKPLESWLPFMGLVPGADPYLSAAAAFARSVRHGVANLMVHYTRVQGGMPYVDEARAVARAARDVGNRIGFALALRDRHGIAYCDDATALAALRPSIRDAVAARLAVKPVSAAQQLALVDDVAQMVDEEGYGEHVTVQYGPTGVQWCSTALLEAIAQASAEHDRPVHLHLLETRYQREWADRTHPEGIVRFLDDIGLLSPRLTLAHCVHARADELERLAERGVTIAINTSSNLYLKSGIAPVPDMLRHGCRVALGLDCTGTDEDNDALREMRLAYQLHRGWGFDVTMDRAQLWAFAAQHGRRSVLGAAADKQPGGRLAPGAAADLVLLDWDALDDDGLLNLDPLDLLLARGSGAHIDQVVIGGRTVVAQGRACGVDEAAVRAELIGQLRTSIAAQPSVHAWHQTLDALSEDLGPFYMKSAWHGCC